MNFAEFGNPPSMKARHRRPAESAGKLPLPQDLAGYVAPDLRLARRTATPMAIHDFEKLSGRTFQRILMVGGGSKNRLLCQATANASGLLGHLLRSRRLHRRQPRQPADRAERREEPRRLSPPLPPHTETDRLPAQALTTDSTNCHGYRSRLNRSHLASKDPLRSLRAASGSTP